jgi:peptidyl-dipeptidase A
MLFTAARSGVWVLVVLAAAAAAAAWAADPPNDAPTAKDAAAFVEQAEASLLRLTIDASRAQWVQSTHITEDTEILAAQANERLIAENVRLAQEATRYDGLTLPDDVARKLDLLKLAITLPAPGDAAKREELTRIAASMEAAYGRGKWCRKGADGKDECLDINALGRILAESRDPAELLDAWRGWRTIAPPMKPEFTRYVELANEGARELGFADNGAMWRSRYDMPADAFAAEVDRLWDQVRPFYESLHAYVRRRLREVYGASVVPERGPIPAHLLGNMWAQQWANIYPLVAPRGGAGDLDLTARLKANNVDAVGMVRYGEAFFSSLGFEPLPDTFWKRSLFVKPRDREVVCHASAWDVDQVDDLRIKMCIEITAEDFVTVHHELGHNYYQRAYNRKPFLFRESANDGFHEAVGDTLALSITPSYLVKVGLLDREPDTSGDVGLLLQTALDKIAFLPFGLLVDQWRWKVFSGEVAPADYNRAWWELREKYQGVAAPVARSAEDFDPGAKYHVPANVSYTRYFLAHILQFQFHKALCEAAGEKGPLNRCSIYGSEEAGRRLRRMLEMGASRPWPEALEALTGRREMDATAILDYFAPLKKWLDEQNRGAPVGWSQGG